MTRLDEIKKKMLELEEETPNWKDTTVYVAGFMDGAMWADAHPHWISVEDELPKEGQSCIILIDRKALQGTPRIRSAVYAPNVMMQQEGFAYNHISKKHHITHWMPLPQPPIISNSEKTGKNHLIDANNMVEHFRETTKMIEKGGEE